MSRVKLRGGFDSHAFPPIRRETPSKSGVFAFPEPGSLLLKNLPIMPFLGTPQAQKI